MVEVTCMRLTLLNEVVLGRRHLVPLLEHALVACVGVVEEV